MKQNKIEHNTRGRTIALLSAGIVLAAAVGLAVCYSQLRNIWLEQCVIRDPSRQISVSEGKMVPADTLAESLGLKTGANLSLIDFEQKRAAVLKRIPNLRALAITRTMPDKVTIVTEERSPIAQLNVRGRKAPTGKVVDADGMVFIHQNGTRMLPVIRETQAPGTACGTLLTGHAFAALQLIETCRDPEFQDLGVLEVDTSRNGYLLATLGDYSQAKIAWTGMGEASADAKGNLRRQLSLLSKTIRSKVGEGSTIWNATDTSDAGYIYADRKGSL